MHEVDDELCIFGRRRRQDAMAEIEDVPWPRGASLGEHAAHTLLEDGLGQEQARGIQISL